MADATSIGKASKASLWGKLSEAAKKLPKRSDDEQLEAVAELERRQSVGLDMWTGKPLSIEDNEARLACEAGRQEKPPITEAALTIKGLQAAKRISKTEYNELCLALDDYLEGGKEERLKYEKLAGTTK